MNCYCHARPKRVRSTTPIDWSRPLRHALYPDAEVRLIAKDVLYANDRRFVIAVKRPHRYHEDLLRVDECGNTSAYQTIANAPARITGWLNVYVHSATCRSFAGGLIYSTKLDADVADEAGERIACVYVDIPEGDGIA